MALAVLHLNLKRHQDELSSEHQSEVFNRMLSFNIGAAKDGISYTKLVQSN
jgi:hypothetical protein